MSTVSIPKGRAGPDQFGALGKIFAGAPTPLDRTVNSTTNDHALRKSAKLCLWDSFILDRKLNTQKTYYKPSES
jgi:hypothetical protein